MPDQAIDLTLTLPPISLATDYTVVAAVTGTYDYNVPVPVVTLVEALISASGYVDEYNYDIPEPRVTLATAYTPVTGVANTEEYQVTVPSITLATRYTAESPVSTSSEYQIMIPTISEPTHELWYYTPVDSFISVVGPSTYTDQTSEANDAVANDCDLFPAVPAVSDGFLIGMDHPYWDRIRIDIGTPAVGDYTITWEYWNGTTWIPISNVEDDTNDLTESGRNNVVFTQPSLWSRKTIDGSDMYWVFMRIAGLVSVGTVPLGTQLWVGEIASRLLNTRQTMNEQPGIEHMTHIGNTPTTSQRGKAFIWQFKLVDFRDNASQRSLLSPTVYASIDGGAFAQINSVVTEVTHGWYYITVSAALATCDRMILRAIAPGAAQCDLTIEFR